MVLLKYEILFFYCLCIFPPAYNLPSSSFLTGLVSNSLNPPLARHRSCHRPESGGEGAREESHRAREEGGVGRAREVASG